jgi:hypothetical protein
MAAKDDASTEIVRLTLSFAEDMTKACAKLRKARMEAMEKDGKKDEKKDEKKKATQPPVVTFELEDTPITKSRTPVQQAELLAMEKPKAWVCWSAHMADKARHVLMKADGKKTWEPKKTMGEDFDAFKKKWAEAMKSNGLKNWKGLDGWGEGDAFHLEIPDGKVPYTDERAAACMVEYARLTREKGQPPNKKFEKDHGSKLAPYLKKYEKKK